MHACTNTCMQETSDTTSLSLTIKRYRELLHTGLMSDNSWLESICAGNKCCDSTSRPAHMTEVKV